MIETNTKKPYKISFKGMTHQGYVREHNEDAWAHLSNLQFFALADGMGGRHGGAVASTEALASLCKELKKSHETLKETLSPGDAAKILEKAVHVANTHVWKLGQQDTHLEGMGTTLCCVWIVGDECVIANVGDSRIYRIRFDEVEQLTQDDSLVADLLKFDIVDVEEAKNFPLKHVITKSVGTLAKVDPIIETFELCAGDNYLLCSDGLSNVVSESQILGIIQRSSSIDEAVESLIQAALDKGGPDNITVILLNVASD